MKLFAKVRIKQDINAEYLINAFFKEFNPQSSIEIRGKEAKVEIVFENSPRAIAKAIAHCEVLEFKYGTLPGESEGDDINAYKEQVEPVAEEEIPKQVEPVTEEEPPKQVEPVAEEEPPKQVEPVVAENITKVVNRKITTIPEIAGLVAEAKSFEHLVNLVADCLELYKRKEFFMQLVLSSTNVDKISWNSLETNLKNKGILFTQWDKIFVGQQISAKFKMPILSFLKAFAQYKNYSYAQEAQNTSSVGQVLEVIENQNRVPQEEATENKTPKIRVKMECMPEIQEFEEVLGCVDKTQPIEERVRNVLRALGIEKKSTEEQRLIFEITNAAVRLSEISFTTIFVKANISSISPMHARMIFSAFINDFVSKYDLNEKVKLLDFLKELQSIIMLESEIEDF